MLHVWRSIYVMHSTSIKIRRINPTIVCRDLIRLAPALDWGWSCWSTQSQWHWIWVTDHSGWPGRVIMTSWSLTLVFTHCGAASDDRAGLLFHGLCVDCEVWLRFGCRQKNSPSDQLGREHLSPLNLQQTTGVRRACHPCTGSLSCSRARVVPDLVTLVFAALSALCAGRERRLFRLHRGVWERATTASVARSTMAQEVDSVEVKSKVRCVPSERASRQKKSFLSLQNDIFPLRGTHAQPPDLGPGEMFSSLNRSTDGSPSTAPRWRATTTSTSWYEACTNWPIPTCRRATRIRRTAIFFRSTTTVTSIERWQRRSRSYEYSSTAARVSWVCSCSLHLVFR